MTYSQKTERELSKYVHKLVRNMPGWLRQLFDDGVIYFLVNDESGHLEVCCESNLSTDRQKKAGKLIATYMDQNPTKALKALVVQ